MKPKQLADVLIKILGLSVCVQSVLHLVSGVLVVIATNSNFGGPALWSNFLTGLILAAIGSYLIVRSRNVAGCLLAREEE
jgi:hypothetical protein